MDAVISERVQIFPPRYAKSYLDWLGEKTRLAREPPALVGAPDTGVGSDNNVGRNNR